MRLKLTRLIIALSLLLCVGFPAAPVSAAAGSISLTASKSTVPSGGTIIIGVYMNGGGNAVNAVQADLSYSAAKLQYIGVNYSGSAFEISASGGGGGGSVSLARGTTGAVGGSGLVGTVTFKALVGSGSTAISVAGSSALAADGNSIPFSSRGVSFNFGAVAASASGASKPSAPVAVTPKDTTPPVITNVKLKDVTPYNATLTWTTSEPADSAVDFGLDAGYGLSSSSKTPTTTHQVALSSSFLTPQTLLHYRAKSADPAGNVATSPDQSFQLPGVPVTIIVRGANGKPQAGATVTLDNDTGITDKAGSVTLTSGLGDKKITTSYRGATIQKPITVAKTVKALPPYQLDLAKQPLNRWMLTSAVLLAAVLVLLGIDAVLFGSRLFSRLVGLHIIPKKLLHAAGHSAVTAVVPLETHPQPEASEPEAPKPEPEPAPESLPPEPNVPTPTSSVLAELEAEDSKLTARPEVPVAPEPPAEPQPLSVSAPIVEQPPAVTPIAVTEPAEASPSASLAPRLKKKPAAKKPKPAKKPTKKVQ